MPDIIFHPDVALEIKSSYKWYEKQAEGLGENFLSELETAYTAIAQFPNTWPTFQNGSYRFLLSKFPFSVIYYPDSNSIYIVAIMHNHRKPGYWYDRKE